MQEADDQPGTTRLSALPAALDGGRISGRVIYGAGDGLEILPHSADRIASGSAENHSACEKSNYELPEHYLFLSNEAPRSIEAVVAMDLADCIPEGKRVRPLAAECGRIARWRVNPAPQHYVS
jgi:hypothetical protein